MLNIENSSLQTHASIKPSAKAHTIYIIWDVKLNRKPTTEQETNRVCVIKLRSSFKPKLLSLQRTIRPEKQLQLSSEGSLLWSVLWYTLAKARRLKLTRSLWWRSNWERQHHIFIKSHKSFCKSHKNLVQAIVTRRCPKYWISLLMASEQSDKAVVVTSNKTQCHPSLSQPEWPYDNYSYSVNVRSLDIK